MGASWPNPSWVLIRRIIMRQIGLGLRLNPTFNYAESLRLPYWDFEALDSLFDSSYIEWLEARL